MYFHLHVHVLILSYESVLLNEGADWKSNLGMLHIYTVSFYGHTHLQCFGNETRGCEGSVPVVLSSYTLNSNCYSCFECSYVKLEIAPSCAGYTIIFPVGYMYM